MGVIVIKTADEFNTHISKSKNEGTVVVVDFTAAWCGPCRMIAPKYEALSNEFPSVTFLKVDVDEVAAVAAQSGISAMPTFHLYKDGEKKGEVVGANENALRALVAANT